MNSLQPLLFILLRKENIDQNYDTGCPKKRPSFNLSNSANVEIFLKHLAT